MLQRMRVYELVEELAKEMQRPARGRGERYCESMARERDGREVALLNTEEFGVLVALWACRWRLRALTQHGTVGNILMCSAFTAWQLWRRVGGHRQSALSRAYQPWKGGTAQRSDRAGPLGSSGRRTIFDVTRLPAVVKAMGTARS